VLAGAAERHMTVGRSFKPDGGGRPPPAKIESNSIGREDLMNFDDRNR